VPSPDLIAAADRHGDRILDRATTDGALLAAIAAAMLTLAG